MTWLLWSRYVFLAALIGIVLYHVWLERRAGD
jgi:hypothetical protein